MKKSFKILLGIVAVVVIVALILMIPPVTMKVAQLTGVASEKIRRAAATIVGAGVGLLLVMWGVAAVASAPVLGAAMVIIGLVMVGYAIYPLFVPSVKVQPAALMNVA